MLSNKLLDNINKVDISESDILEYCPEVLDKLLIDHTLSAKKRNELKDPNAVVNISWLTSDYAYRGEGYSYKDQIKVEKITGLNERIIMPRVLKDSNLQFARSKEKAEVFTPSWMCNAQNNLIDEAWFGRKEIFNVETITEDGTHTWIPTDGKIEFPANEPSKTWKKYVRDNRMEITCGEAPYLASRYDTTTGQAIPLNKRIGLIDRKLRVISENCDNEKEWLAMAQDAYKHTYGYEWQGDNLLLAREALLYSFIEYFMAKFEHPPLKTSVISIARIISWNIWQMDGIRMVIPDSCDDIYYCDLWGQTIKQECKGCKEGGFHNHIGDYCLIRDWNRKKPKDWNDKESLERGEDPKSSPWQKIHFISLLNRQSNDSDTEN